MEVFDECCNVPLNVITKDIVPSGKFKFYFTAYKRDDFYYPYFISEQQRIFILMR